MPTLNLLFKKSYAINEHINLVIPEVGQILDDEDSYYDMVSKFTAMPIDYMVPLDDAGIDFTAIDEYELFLLLFPAIQHGDTHLIFGDLDLSKFRMMESQKSKSIVLYDQENDIVIDRFVHAKIAASLRKIHHIEQNRRKPANKAARDYLLQRARAKLKRRRNRTEFSQLESLIIAMVNTEQYKYDFDGTRKLSIYQFNESVRQVIHKVDYDNRMYGVYSGSIDAKSLSQDDFNWLAHK